MCFQQSTNIYDLFEFQPSIEPPIPDNSTNLIRNYQGGTTVDFGAKVKYEYLMY